MRRVLRACRREQGNVTMLMITFCMICLFISLVTTDIFMILYARRVAQTSADTAAIGAVRAAIPVVGHELWRLTYARLEEIYAEAEVEHNRRRDQWRSDRRTADDACRESAAPPAPPDDPDPGAGAEEPGEEEEPAPPPDPEEIERRYRECMADWDADHPEPLLEDVEEEMLRRYTDDQALIDALVGRGGVPSISKVAAAVLTPAERLCSLEAVRSEMEQRVTMEAEKYVDRNGGSLVLVNAPYNRRPQVLVEVAVTAPAVVIGRFSDTPLVIRRLAVARMESNLDAGEIPDDCARR